MGLGEGTDEGEGWQGKDACDRNPREGLAEARADIVGLRGSGEQAWCVDLGPETSGVSLVPGLEMVHVSITGLSRMPASQREASLEACFAKRCTACRLS